MQRPVSRAVDGARCLITDRSCWAALLSRPLRTLQRESCVRRKDAINLRSQQQLLAAHGRRVRAATRHRARVGQLLLAHRKLWLLQAQRIALLGCKEDISSGSGSGRATIALYDSSIFCK